MRFNGSSALFLPTFVLFLMSSSGILAAGSVFGGLSPSCLRQLAASALIGTPLEKPVKDLRRLAQARSRRKHPELKEIFDEEFHMEELFKTVVTPGMNCIDGGAHLGSVTAPLVRLSPTGKHMAIEPMPDKAALLRNKFKGVEVIEAALGKQAGHADFFINARSGFNSLQGSSSQAKISVDLEPLDLLVPQDRKIGFIKLDLEGGEYDALLGAKQTILRERPVILFECTRSALENFKMSPADMYSLLKAELKYEILFVKDAVAFLRGSENLSAGALTLDTFAQSILVYPFQAFNFVAIPEEKMGEGN